MPSPVDDRLDSLGAALAGVLVRLEAIEGRLACLEGRQPAPRVSEKPPQMLPPLPSEPLRPIFAPAPSPPPPAAEPVPEPAPEFETRLGLTWINRVAALTLIFAVAFAFKYAVDNQYIGETGRVALGIITGFATLTLAEVLWRRGHRIYAQGVTGLGISVLYLSFYAFYGFYHLVEQGIAFALLTLTTAMAGALAVRYNAAPIFILGLIGGFLTPPLLATNQDRPWAFFGYLLVLDLGALTVARNRRWRQLQWVAFAGTAILYSFWYMGRFEAQKRLVATVYALAFYALFALAEVAWVRVASQFLANAAVLLIWAPPHTGYLWLALVLAAAGLAISERWSWREGPPASFGAFWLGCAAWQADLPRPVALGEILLTLTVGFLLFLGWSAWRSLVRRAEATKSDLLVIALNCAAYFAICYHLLEPGYHAYLGAFSVALAAIHLGLGLRIRAALCLGVALCLVTLAVPIQLSGFHITVAWALEAAALSWIANRTGSPRLPYMALGVFALAVARLAGIDALIFSSPADYYTIVNTRFLTFAITAVCLWSGARWIPTGILALVPYVTGHVAGLSALIMEVLGWAARTASEENAANLSSVGVSIVMAFYGMVLVALGVLRRAALDRILGLTLLAGVVIKLYFYDVWQLGRFYRVVAFGGLGILLLITSFLYSRYRTRIENWWREERT